MTANLATTKILALALATSLSFRAQAGAIFERNALSVPNISDINMPASSSFVPLPAPPGATDGYVGPPEIPGPNGEVGGGNGGRGGDDAGVEGQEGREGRESQEGREGRESQEGREGQESRDGRDRGEQSSQDGGDQNTQGQQDGSKSGRDADSREKVRADEARERENRSDNDKERENRDRGARAKDAREREQKSKGDDKEKVKAKRTAPGRGTNSAPKSSRGGYRERSGSNSDFKEVARMAQAPTGSVSDMPAKYLQNRDYPPIPYWPIPATTIGTPSAHGADWTDVFAGVGLQNRARYGTLPNSTAIVGFGVGDAQRNVGMEISLSSYGLIRHGLPFTTGGISLKLHHYFSDWQLGAAAGYENAIYWGAPDSGQSFYLVFSKYFLIGRGSKHEPFRTLFVHFGLGDGRFRAESAVRAGRNSISPFVAFAMRVAEPVNMIANWTGSDLSLGLSVTPFRVTPISFGVSALDVLKQAGDGVRFSLVISYGDSVTNPTFPVSWWHDSRPGR